MPKHKYVSESSDSESISDESFDQSFEETKDINDIRINDNFSYRYHGDFRVVVMNKNGYINN